MWSLSSRVHPLNHFPHQGVSCFVKRDDELGCGISGTKIRKYASLVPYLRQQKISHLLIIAGPQSNNLLAALQVAREHGLKVTAFLLKPTHDRVQGNFKLSLLFLNEKDICWIERQDWPQIKKITQRYAADLSDAYFILDEGASVPQALQGSLTLASDILANEKSLGFNFDHIFIDAGSGFSAAALIKGLADNHHRALIHVVLLADDEQTFKDKLLLWTGLAAKNYRCFLPKTAKAFGAINQTIRAEIIKVAKEEGILLDPIYSAKLFHAARHHIVTDYLQGRVLIIHSGGALTLAGFDLT